MLTLWLLACTSGVGEDPTAPSIEFLTPEDGDTVTAGPVSVTLIVENFVLADIAKHGGEGETATGTIEVTVDGGVVLETGETNFDVELAAGDVLLAAELLYADGDPLDPPVVSSVELLVE